MLFAKFVHSARSKGKAFVMLTLAATLVMLSACNTAGDGATGNGTEPTVQPTVAEMPTAEPTPNSTVEPISKPITAPIPTPVVEATHDPAHYFPTPAEQERAMQVAQQLIDSIPQPIAAPEGWQVARCEGVAPLLCLQAATGETGATELGVYPLRTYSDYYPILERNGIPFGTIDVASEAYQVGAPQVLEEIAQENLATFAADRAVGRAEWHFNVLETKPIRFGVLPGLQYGFTMTDSAGGVQERMLAHVAFDTSHIYFWVTTFDPLAIPGLPTDEMVLAFEPYLLDLLAALPLPQTNAGQP